MRALNVPLVWYNLIHDRRRTAVGVLGVAFSSILMFMQLGFLGAVRSTATTILDKLDFDVLLVSPTYLYLYDAGSFPRIRLDQARSVAGVREAVPLYLGFNVWSRQAAPAGKSAVAARESEQERAIFVIGYNAAHQPFEPSKLAALSMRICGPDEDGGCRDVRTPRDFAPLKRPDTLLFDRLSHRDFGPLAELDPCDESSMAPGSGAAHGPARLLVGRRDVRVVGSFELATGFGADGAIIVSDQNFSRIFGGHSLDEVSLGLVRTSRNAERVAADLERILPGDDVRAIPRARIMEQETAYWIRERPIGVIFALGLCVACAVGIVFVYQILSSDITNRFSEFATLKAMGYPDNLVASLVLKQALFLAHAGYVPGLIVSIGLADLIRSATNVPVAISWPDALAVYLATTVMCSVSAVLSVGKVRRADPADLFA